MNDYDYIMNSSKVLMTLISGFYPLGSVWLPSLTYSGCRSTSPHDLATTHNIEVINMMFHVNMPFNLQHFETDKAYSYL